MKAKLTMLWYLVLFRVTMVAAIAMGQTADAVVPPPADAGVGLGTLAAQFLSALHDRKVALAVALGVLAVTKLLMWAGKKYPQTTDFGARLHSILDSNLGSWGIPMLVSVSGAAVTSLTAGQGISLDLIMEAVLLGLAGGGLTAPASPAVPPPPAMTKQQAVAEIKGP